MKPNTINCLLALDFSVLDSKPKRKSQKMPTLNVNGEMMGLNGNSNVDDRLAKMTIERKGMS